MFSEFADEDLGPELGELWWDRRFHFYFPPYCLDLPKAFGTMDTVATYDKIIPVYHAMKEAVETNFPNAVLLPTFPTGTTGVV